MIKVNYLLWSDISNLKRYLLSTLKCLTVYCLALNNHRIMSGPGFLSGNTFIVKFQSSVFKVFSYSIDVVRLTVKCHPFFLIFTKRLKSCNFVLSARLNRLTTSFENPGYTGTRRAYKICSCMPTCCDLTVDYWLIGNLGISSSILHIWSNMFSYKLQKLIISMNLKRK